MVLVDGADGFDPGSFSSDACEKLLWVRCRCAMEMIKAADLLVHDGNMPFVLLDAMGLDRRDLGKVPSSAWWRLRAGRGTHGLQAGGDDGKGRGALREREAGSRCWDEAGGF